MMKTKLQGAQEITSKELGEGCGPATCSRIEFTCKLLENCRKYQPLDRWGRTF